MERGEATERRRQRAPGNLLDHTETHRAGEARRFGGTPAYMAPEQFAARTATQRSDLFSLGLILSALGIDQPLYYSVHSAYAQLTPSGGALIHAAKYGGDPAAEPELEKLLDDMQPGWRDVVVHRRFLPQMTVSNAIAEPARDGAARRPPASTPIRGLYLAGDWVGDDGILSDAALSSARAAAKGILAE